MNTRIVTASALTVIAGLAGSSSARQAYEKPLLDNGDNGAFSYADQLLADDFVLSADTAIAQATWYGTYFVNSDPFNTGDSVNFTVRFFNPDGDRPSLSAFFEQTITASVTDTGVNSTEGGQRRYLFSASFNAVALSGGTKYYFSVEEVDSKTGKPDFRWSNGSVDGDDDNLAFRVGGQWNLSTDTRSGTAFTLSIPAPSTAALAIAGTLLASRRRR